MPTIAEIIAAKKAAASTPATPTAKKEPAPDPMLEAAINRIDPPAAGKRRAGLVLSASTPPPPPVPAQPEIPDPRSLSMTKGEAIPMTPSNADQEVATWHEALNAFESQLCVMRDPQDSDVAWLAIRPDRAGLPPLLVCRLPWTLWDYPHPPTDCEPF